MFQQAPANYMDMRLMMNNYELNSFGGISGSFKKHKHLNNECIIAKLIYSYIQYQNSFEKSATLTDGTAEVKNTTAPGLIQQSIIPLPAGTHVHHDVTH